MLGNYVTIEDEIQAFPSSELSVCFQSGFSYKPSLRSTIWRCSNG